MPQQPKPLDRHQQELVNIVKAAHQTLAIARKTRSTERVRRISEERIRLDREFEKSKVQIDLDLDAEVLQHESNLDDALIAAYDAAVPIRRIAFEGFGNRYDGGVQQLIVKLRQDGRVGNREGYQRNTEEVNPAIATAFPQPINVGDILAKSTTVAQPTFTATLPLELVAASAPGAGDDVTVPAVVVELDSRDPWFDLIKNNARLGTPHLRATGATLYLHPATGEIRAYESAEAGEVVWDHPVARWVKEHPDAARAGYEAALAEAAE